MPASADHFHCWRVTVSPLSVASRTSGDSTVKSSSSWRATVMGERSSEGVAQAEIEYSSAQAEVLQSLRARIHPRNHFLVGQVQTLQGQRQIRRHLIARGEIVIRARRNACKIHV